jgi:GNAT superfamily N-acetyltransferase
MTATDTVSSDGVRIRVRAWRGRPDTAECLATPAGALVPPALVRSAMERARARGYAVAVTPALPPFEWNPYVECGFGIRERLHLLGHGLTGLPPRTEHRLRRATRHDHERVLAIDHAAFEPFWRLDAAGLEEAIRATPSSRFRLARDARAYSLIGRAGDRGYVQRLAVHPDDQGAGLGRGLVIDGLWWLRRWRVRDVLVNTQEGNERAVALYEGLGFDHRPGGLAVLEADLSST